jgi:hypothetical protein
MELTDREREIIKPYRWHSGELPPPAHWEKLNTRFPVDRGAREPDKETRREFCALWNEVKSQLQGKLNAWLAPGPLSLELRRYGADDDIIFEVRRRLNEQFGKRIQFEFF